METYTQMTLKKLGDGHIIVVICLQHVTYVNQCKITINMEIVLTLSGVKTKAIKTNNNVDVKACFT